MGKYRKNPRYNVLSLRVSDKDLEALEEQSLTTNKSISDLMREALLTIAAPKVSSDNNNTGENTV